MTSGGKPSRTPVQEGCINPHGCGDYMLIHTQQWSDCYGATCAEAVDLNLLASPVLFRGDARTAYRDPAAIHHEGVFHLYMIPVSRGFVIRLLAALLLAPLPALRAQEPPDTNYDESKVPPYTLPDPLICFDGRRVTNVTLWRCRARWKGRSGNQTWRPRRALVSILWCGCWGLWGEFGPLRGDGPVDGSLNCSAGGENGNVISRHRDAAIGEKPRWIDEEDIARWFRWLGRLNITIDKLYSHGFGLFHKFLRSELISKVQDK